VCEKANILDKDTCAEIGTEVPRQKEVLFMAKCAVCGKGVHFGNAVSHSHRRSNKIWKSNLKSVRVKVNGGTKKMYVCASCLRSGKVERA